MTSNPYEELGAKYEDFKKDNSEVGSRKRLVKLNEEIMKLFLANDLDSAACTLDHELLDLWVNHAKARVEEVEEYLHPRILFEDSFHSELRGLKRKIAEAEAEVARLEMSLIDKVKDILNEATNIKERAVISRSRSAANAVTKILTTGIVASLSSLIVISKFTTLSLLLVPIPFAIMALAALIGYTVVKKFPSIIKTTRATVVSVLNFLVVMILSVSATLALATGSSDQLLVVELMMVVVMVAALALAKKRRSTTRQS